MQRFRIGVFSDTHIGRNIPRVVGDARRKAFRHVFKQAVDIFVKEKVDYVLHGGDIFEKRSMTPEDAVFVKEEFYRLVSESEKDVQIIAVRGNHDGSPTSSALDFITHPIAKYFHVIGDKVLTGTPESFSDKRLRVSAMGYHPYAKKKIMDVAEVLKESLRGEEYKILLIHNYVDGIHDIPPITPDHSVIAPKTLKSLGADLVITGHHHESRGLIKRGDQTYLVPGATEAIDLAEKKPFSTMFTLVNDW